MTMINIKGIKHILLIVFFINILILLITTIIYSNQQEYYISPYQSKGNAVSGKLFDSNPKKPPIIFTSPNFQKTEGQKCSIPIIAVTTTIKGESDCANEVSKLMPVIVVGDLSSPEVFKIPKEANIEFLSLKKQKEYFPDLDVLLPVKHFSRKNLGYLRALERGACYIWDFDDDNFLKEDTIALLKQVIEANSIPRAPFQLTSKLSVVNPYLIYGAPEFIWPRGYPLEMLSERDFPQMIPGDQSVIDVLQFMQERDPDVDANWRLEYAKQLPMFWNQIEPMKKAAVTIHPLRMTPFNAQATLISRRAAAFAMLPLTVHGRVSDIWRSYFMQYLMKLLPDGGGRLAFSGAVVDHRRNAHSYMADRQAELQLAEQTLALVSYLESREPKANDNILNEYVLLMDDLYQRGFIEKEDIQAVLEWCKLVHKWLPSSSIQLNQFRDYSQPIKNNMTAVVHINSGMKEIAPIWLSIHGHQFENVRFYVPDAQPDCKPISGLNINCISKDRKGYFAYESIIHSIEELLKIEYKPGDDLIDKYDYSAFKNEGLIFLHDDVIWKETKFQTSISQYAPLEQILRKNSSEYWFSLPIGLEAFYKLENVLNRKFDEYIKGQSDEFILTPKDFFTFLKYGKKILNERLFLEFAVPLIMQDYLKDATNEKWSLHTDFMETRTDYALQMEKFCNGNFLFLHPIKFSTIDGVTGHFGCKTFFSSHLY